jgi:hypothetical protein
MPDNSLLLAVDEIRGKTLLLLQGVGDREARFAPPGLHNTILWHAGHCYILAEWLALMAAGQTPQAPQGWYEMFSWDSHPATVPPDAWPALSVVVDALSEQHQRLKRVGGALSDVQLAAAPVDRAGRTLRYYIQHALHDEACHGGEIWLLRKMWVKKKG